MRRMMMAVSMLATSFAGVAQAEDARHARCRRIVAEVDVAQGTISGNFGLNGSAIFTSDGQGTPAPTSPPGSSVFSGRFVVSTDHGTLTVRETGMFSSRTGNPDGAILASWGDSPVGTGVFEGVSGDLFFLGRDVDGVLLVKVLGTLCRP